MIVATGFNGSHQLAKPDCLEILLGQVQIFKTPAYLLWRHRFAFAKLFLGGPNRLDGQHRDHHAARVGNGADCRAVCVAALPFVVDQGLELIVHLTAACRIVNRHGVIAFSDIAQILHITL